MDMDGFIDNQGNFGVDGIVGPHHEKEVAMMRISEYISLVTAETECFIHFPKVEFLF